MKVLVISAHPDDETLGCGGTLLKHRSEGDELHWLIATRVEEPKWTAEQVATKANEIAAVGSAYGMASQTQLDFLTTSLSKTPESQLIDSVARVIGDIQPEVVYVVNGSDVHSDHGAVYSAVTSVLKPMYMKRAGVRRILAFETLSSTEAAPPGAGAPFVPNVFQDITGFLDSKIERMEIYASEVQTWLMPRSASAIRALARYRGSTIGVEHAEAFMLVREIA